MTGVMVNIPVRDDKVDSLDMKFPGEKEGPLTPTFPVNFKCDDDLSYIFTWKLALCMLVGNSQKECWLVDLVKYILQKYGRQNTL